MRHDIHSNVKCVRAIDNTSQTNADAIVGNIVDTAKYSAVGFAVLLGTLAASAVSGTITMEHGDDSGLSDAAAVPSAELKGTLTFDQDDDDTAIQFGYTGVKRYVRATVTPTGNDAALDLYGVAVLGHAEVAPT